MENLVYFPYSMFIIRLLKCRKPDYLFKKLVFKNTIHDRNIGLLNNLICLFIHPLRFKKCCYQTDEIVNDIAWYKHERCSNKTNRYLESIALLRINTSVDEKISSKLLNMGSSNVAFERAIVVDSWITWPNEWEWKTLGKILLTNIMIFKWFKQHYSTKAVLEEYYQNFWQNVQYFHVVYNIQ